MLHLVEPHRGFNKMLRVFPPVFGTGKSACGTCHFGLEFSTAELAPGMIPQVTKASRVAGNVPAE